MMQEAAGEDAFDEALCMTPERPAFTPSTGSEPVQNLWTQIPKRGLRRIRNSENKGAAAGAAGGKYRMRAAGATF